MTTYDETKTARTVRFPTLLNEQLQSIADDEDRTFTSVVVDACRSHLGVHGRTKVTRDELEVPDGDGNPPTVELVPRLSSGGEAAYHAVLVEGIEVPHLRVMELDPGTPGGLEHERSYVLTVDDRFGTVAVPYAELWRWLWVMAQAMAVSAGFTSHGPDARLLNPHGPSLPLWDSETGRCSPACGGGHPPTSAI